MILLTQWLFKRINTEAQWINSIPAEPRNICFGIKLVTLSFSVVYEGFCGTLVVLRKESWRQLAPVVMWWMEMECQKQSIAGCSENTGGTGRTIRYRVIKTGVVVF